MKPSKVASPTKKELEAMAQQLAAPHGAAGILTAQKMQENNQYMIEKAVDLLELNANDTVLEVGPGNGTHLPYILSKATHIKYTGLDISPTMIQEATRLHPFHIQNEQARFTLGDGHTLPFEDNSFSKCFTVNTVYFWKEPGKYLMEFYRVLQPHSIFCISFAPESFMKQLPFTAFGFTLYEAEDLVKLLTEAGFKINNIVQEAEEVMSYGTKYLRTFAVIVAEK